MFEAALERSLGAKLKKLARQRGMPLLYSKVNMGKGWPDRLVLWPGGMLWIELKVPGEKPRALQTYIHQQLAEVGQTVLVINNTAEGFDQVLAYVDTFRVVEDKPC